MPTKYSDGTAVAVAGTDQLAASRDPGGSPTTVFTNWNFVRSFVEASSALEKTAQKGVANGYASLDGSGDVPSGQLGNAAPASHVTDTGNPHSVTAAQVGAPTTGDFTGHTGNTSNPHSVTAAQVGAPTTGDFTGHTGNTSNPHSVTAAQVGAPTTGDFTGHTGNTSNPHSVTKAQVGLGNVENVKALPEDVTIQDETGGSYTVVTGDKTKLLIIDDPFTIPTGLVAGEFWTIFNESGSKQAITTTGVTVQGTDADTSISPGGTVHITSRGSNTVILNGDMEP